MVSDICLNQAIGALEGIAAQRTTATRKNVMLANLYDPFVKSVISYILGIPNPGYNAKLIYSSVFYVAKPKMISDWYELMEYFEKHQSSGDDNLLIAQYFIRQQPMEQWEVWRRILSKSFDIADKNILKQELEEFNERTY